MKEACELKPEQITAAHTLDRHVSVTAGPGSGKTTVLVARYLHILRQNKNLHIDQIVAITFTNRAANEMRQRLRKDLECILRNCSGPERQRWMRYKRTLDGAIITTIHGFCARLLRELPVEARVDPEFLLLDSHDAAILLEAAVEETLTEFISRERELISQLAVGFGRGKLAAALGQLYSDVRGQGLNFDELQQRTLASHASTENHKQALAALDQTMNELIGCGRLPLAAEAKRGYARSNWSALRRLLQAEQPSLAEYCDAIENFRASARMSRNSPVGPLIDRLDEQLWGAEKKGPLGTVPQICFDRFAKEYALEVIHVLKEVEWRYREKKQSLAALDFDDLQLRALQLLDQPSVLARATQKYLFFLVDEFQDTNCIQRDLMHKLTLELGTSRANLFIVGDQKQSIYGFRGADVDVFQQTTQALKAAGGIEQPLHLNFRSQPALIDFFNQLFERLFQPLEKMRTEHLGELGFVTFEPGKEQREQELSTPAIELLIDAKSQEEDDPKVQRTQAERDAEQVAQRIISLIQPGTETGPATNGGKGVADRLRYSDIALLFRAMTDVRTYEAVFRSANIPFQTVQGKGFYERQEISDLIQLLRFLDNKTDEIALAAVLRSPIGGVSDNALLALRCAPWLNETEKQTIAGHFSHPRKLFYAIRHHSEISYLDQEDHDQLDRTSELLGKLIERRNHYPIANLLRFAVEESEYLTIIAANFDGAQRLANVQKLFSLAERFARSGAHLVRDFVRYVEEFEAIGSREGEGQIDDSANAVRLMSIHQAKGLEFPVVVIPNLHHRNLKPQEHWYALDRHRGLTLKIPDGRGKQIAGLTLENFRERARLREHFESVRLLYVAATRAKDRLILSGVTEALSKLSGAADTWLKLIWQSLELNANKSCLVRLGGRAQLAITVNLAEHPLPHATSVTENAEEWPTKEAESLLAAFPLLTPVTGEPARTLHHLSVSQLVNYQRCPRQYYFDRLLKVPTSEQMAVWNSAEAPEPPANLTATLKGAVIHRFCETFLEGDNLPERLERSFDDVLNSRRAQLADRLVDINRNEALQELLPLAQNYLCSPVFERVMRARSMSANSSTWPARSATEVGLWSELSFCLRRTGTVLTGTIDKLLVLAQDGNAFDIEIIDFKTNRLRTKTTAVRTSQNSRVGQPPGNHLAPSAKIRPHSRRVPKAPTGSANPQQYFFEFSHTNSWGEPLLERDELSIEDEVQVVAADYQLQMQAYALAVRELIPDFSSDNLRVRATLHFLQPGIEFQLKPELLEANTCARAVDAAIDLMIFSSEPTDFLVRPAPHCRTCNFLEFCAAGQEQLAATRCAA